MIFKIVLFILSSLKLSLCSRVIDSASQNSILISDYCPDMKYCPEGTHVLCMYYDEASPRGPLCRNYVPTDISRQEINLFLEIINTARSRVATGVERGRDNEPLPRGYGMMRLKWDKELATFAQILADQCFLSRGDDCRATNRFPNPSQSMSLMNFYYPDWGYFTNSINDTHDIGLTEEKVLYGIRKAVGAWVPDKKTVTKEQILNYPAHEHRTSVERLYMNAVRGSATHMGCGVSAFSKFNFAENHRNDIVNMLEIICNFSDSPQESQPVYMTDPPIPGTGFSDECGCPTGYKETEGCLCEEDEAYIKPTTSTVAAYYKGQQRYKLTGPKHIDEEFTQAPLAVPRGHTYNQVYNSNEPSNLNKPKTRFNKIRPGTQYAFLPIFNIQSAPNIERTNIVNRPSPIKFDNSTFVPRESAVKYSKNSDENYERIKDKPTKKHKHEELFFVKSKDTSKEFDDSVTVLRRAYNDRRPKVEASAENSIEEAINKYNHLKELSDLTDLTDLSSPEEINSHTSSNRRSYNNEDNTNANLIKQLSDHNLMNLLDMLEHKVRNIDMNFKEKEIFDAKMRKIYKTVWSRQKQMQQSRRQHQSIKNQQTNPNPQAKQKQFVPADSRDIESEFKELNDLLKLKSQHTFDHESFHNMRKLGNEHVLKSEQKGLKTVFRQNNGMPNHKLKFDQLDRDIIDDKLLEILRHKSNQIINDGEIKSNDINGRQTYMDRHMDFNDRKSNDVLPNNDLEPIEYDDERDYSNVPVPRKQETFSKYDKRSSNSNRNVNNNVNAIDLPDPDDRKVVKLHTLHANSDVDYNRRESLIPKIGKEHIIGDRRINGHRRNTFRQPERRMPPYHDDPEQPQNTRVFRRIEDYNLERPIRRFQMNEINTQWTNKIHRLTNPYYLSDRATY